MKEPVKVNYYYSICEFTVGGDTWHVLSDANTCVLARYDYIFCVDKDKQLYSLRYDKDANTTTLTGKSLCLMIMKGNALTVIREG